MDGFVDIREITVGHVHAGPGDPEEVAAMPAWLLANPTSELPAIEVTSKPNGTYRIYDGRQRFLAYVLAERPRIPSRSRPPAPDSPPHVRSSPRTGGNSHGDRRAREALQRGVARPASAVFTDRRRG